MRDPPGRKLFARNAFVKDEGESGRFEEVQISCSSLTTNDANRQRCSHDSPAASGKPDLRVVVAGGSGSKAETKRRGKWSLCLI